MPSVRPELRETQEYLMRPPGQPLRDLGAVRGDPNANFPIFGVSRRIATEEVFVDVPT